MKIWDVAVSLLPIWPEKLLQVECTLIDMVNRDNQSLEGCGIDIAEEPMLSCE